MSNLPDNISKKNILTLLILLLMLATLPGSIWLSTRPVKTRSKAADNNQIISPSLISSPTPTLIPGRRVLFIAGKVGADGPLNSLSDINDLMNQVIKFWNEMVPQLNFQPQVTYHGPFILDPNLFGPLPNPNCENNIWSSSLENMAVDNGVVIREDDFVIRNIYFPDGICSANSSGGPKLRANLAGYLSSNDPLGNTVNMAIHEMGHAMVYPFMTYLATLHGGDWGFSHRESALGLGNACQVDKIDIKSFDPVTSCPLPTDPRVFSGDDPMGGGTQAGQTVGFSAGYRYILSTFVPGDILEINPSDVIPDGTLITLSPLDTGISMGGSDYPGPHLLKVNRTDGTSILFSYRKKEGWDSRLDDSTAYNRYFLNGATVDYFGNNAKPDLFQYWFPYFLTHLNDSDYLKFGENQLIKQVSHDNQKLTLIIDTTTPTSTPTPTPIPSPTPTLTPSPTPVLLTPTPALSNQLLLNPGFELDANRDGKPDNWTTNKNFTRSVGRIHSGSFAGRHFANNNAGYSINQTVKNIVAGSTYAFSGWTNIPDTSDSFTYNIQLIWKNAGGSNLRTDTVKTFNSNSGGWKQTLATVVSPTKAVSVIVRMNVASLKDYIFADDFSLRKE
ncbi:hypothetical protein A3D78_06605 [Candidatus Gottesmanbacteria bacterium RIFCSPHIGHO2_02_FULL_39_14]|uniref:CBM-cenC domain-containing protein n=1 Tax=Candidatus Gottesmanbacteria bacterium RIFCSPHIGHO2_02_FULL_39_14 TaxID=1798383 RepID=A0A1F5ZWV5_9BACT|nr:MAG: hypothetical protein A3D78_06605 [Candidatus Gottesmanbacteria bacterium RIFCSPHIGHO2_02_FULL_39_14]